MSKRATTKSHTQGVSSDSLVLSHDRHHHHHHYHKNKNSMYEKRSYYSTNQKKIQWLVKIKPILVTV